MADVKNPAASARDEAGHNHAFDHEVGHVLHDEAVFDGARFTLIGIANDVLFFARCVADDLPFAASRKAGAAHATQAGRFESGNDPGPIRSLDELPHGRIVGRAVIRIRKHRQRFVA